MKSALSFKQQGQEVALSHGIMTIGREKVNKMVVSEPTISNRHAKIVTFNKAAYIHDLGSTNGTYVNDIKIECQRLRAGDLVKVGEYSFKIAAID